MCSRLRICSIISCFVLFLVLTWLGSDSGLAREPVGPAWNNKISPAVLRFLERADNFPENQQALDLIVRVKQTYFDREEARAKREGRHQQNALRVVHSYSVRLKSDQIRQLLQSSLVEYVTVDAAIRPTFSASSETLFPSGITNESLRAIGADLVHQQGVTGEGVTVAVFDSGMASHHDLGKGSLRAAVDFTGSRYRVSAIFQGDEYGHGTHVAGIIGGSGESSDGYYVGVAPEVGLVDLKVIDENGVGRTSDLLQAIDWTISNKDEYGIGVANLSLGHPPVDSFRDDPLCQAVERMVAAGIVTVVSAGNLGKTPRVPEVWGAISSPGNSPAVITVGAINSNGTAVHWDDVNTSYASRGPTYLDGLPKPDLVAPGNGIGSTLAVDSYLDVTYPELRLSKRYISLSGSSMATALVSGTVALMLSSNPALSPSLVKAILGVSAIKLQQPHLLEQGNGLVNTWTAVQLARQLDVDASCLRGPVSATWSLDGEEVWAGGAMAIGDRIFRGSMVSPDAPLFWGSNVYWPSFLQPGSGVDWLAGLFSPDSVVWTDSILWTDSVVWTDSILWTDSVVWTDSILWTDSVVWTDSILWTDSVIWSDTLLSDLGGLETIVGGD